MFKVRDLEVTYMKGAILILRGVSLDIEEGSIITVLGGNGGGKSTLLKAISGLLYVEEGEISFGRIEFDGERIDRLNAQDIARLGIIQIMEGRQVLEQLTVEQNLKAGALVLGRNINVKDDIEKVYGYFPVLRRLRKNTSGYLSGGEQQMLVIGRALMSHPRLMLLDEPSMGLSPLLRDEIFGIVKSININEKAGILLVEQNALEALSLASYGYVMENGRIVLDGRSDTLAKNEDVREFYLGLGAEGKRKSYRDVKHYKRRKRWIA
jgi:branched-chain amino acid transport system ATP-binding protein